MAWRTAKSLLKLKEQIDKASPNRNKASDGTVGDAAHATRDSDHNPWVMDGATGVVTALDITNDPAHGVDAAKIADILRLSGDPRIKYIISCKRIANVGQPWRKYSGKNPHDKHFHISVSPKKEHYDSAKEWNLTGAEIKTPIITVIKEAIVGPSKTLPTLSLGSKGVDVEVLQKKLGVSVDGHFGPRTEAAVKKAQKKGKVEADGIVGPYTWAIL